MITGQNDKSINFSYLIHSSKNTNVDLGGKIGIIVKNWSRSCGYNVILEAERLQEDTGLAKIMVVANRFSTTAKELAEKLGIITLTNGELISIRGMYMQEFSSSAFDP
jgi:hypothetical protein